MANSKSYSIILLSVAVEAMTDVSVWLKASAVMVSTAFGHWSTSGAAVKFSMSKTLMALEAAAKALRDLW
jgi:hypothetical protein